jgi:ABC-type nitrate/sulfonate/bicarbonate transport system substrate-binding protein
MNKKLIISFLIILISFIYFKKHSSEKTVKIGIQTSPAMALLMIAKDKDFFEKNGKLNSRLHITKTRKSKGRG